MITTSKAVGRLSLARTALISKRHIGRLSLLACAVVMLGASAAEATGQAPMTAAAGKPAVTFEADAVVARVTPGASTVWFGVVSAPSGFMARVYEHATIIADSDRDGVVRYEVAGVGGSDSVWLVVDMITGNEMITGNPDVPSRHTPLPSAATSRAAVAAPIRRGGDPVSFWVVRPGVGAWRTIVGDGDSVDGDLTHDGRATAVLERFEPVAGSPRAPAAWSPRDVIVAVEAFNLTTSFARVEK